MNGMLIPILATVFFNGTEDFDKVLSGQLVNTNYER